MKSPTIVKEVQNLNGKVTTLSQFISKVAHTSLPLYQLLHKGLVFEWFLACEDDFQDFNRILSCPSILVKPELG